jgi:hypothetical protein
VPCFALDGQYILATVLSVNRSPELVESDQQKLRYVYVVLMTVGTILLLSNIVLGVFSLVASKMKIF